MHALPTCPGPAWMLRPGRKHPCLSYAVGVPVYSPAVLTYWLDFPDSSQTWLVSPFSDDHWTVNGTCPPSPHLFCSLYSDTVGLCPVGEGSALPVLWSHSATSLSSLMEQPHSYRSLWYYCRRRSSLRDLSSFHALQMGLMKLLLKKVTESMEQVKRKHSLMKEFVTYFFCGFPEQLGSRFLEVPVDLSLWSPQSLVPWHGAYPLPFHVQKGRNQWLQCVLIKLCITHSTEDFWQAPSFVKRKNSFYTKNSLELGELIWNRGIKTSVFKHTHLLKYTSISVLSLDAPLKRILCFSCDQNFCLHHVVRTYYQKNKRTNIQTHAPELASWNTC